MCQMCQANNTGSSSLSILMSERGFHSAKKHHRPLKRSTNVTQQETIVLRFRGGKKNRWNGWSTFLITILFLGNKVDFEKVTST